jgi:hypothetical protein
MHREKLQAYPLLSIMWIAIHTFGFEINAVSNASHWHGQIA